MANVIVLHPIMDTVKRLTHIQAADNGHLNIKWTNESGSEETLSLNFSRLVNKQTPQQLDIDIADPLLAVVRFGDDFLWDFSYYHADDATLVTLDKNGRLPAESTPYPQYRLWPVGEMNAPLTGGTERGHAGTLTDAQKELITVDWKERLNTLAYWFEANDRAKKWAHESSGGDVIAATIDATNQDRLNNTSRHWVKGIGMAWRIVKEFEDNTYSSHPVATSVRTNPTDANSAVTINAFTGAGIDEMITALENEYRIFSQIEGDVNNPILVWHYAAGSTTNLSTWKAYYNARQWWFTNYGTASGAYIWFTAATAEDWSDLWDQFTKARDYK